MSESTVSVSRNRIEVDRIGAFKPVFAQIGRPMSGRARMHREGPVFGLPKAGFATNCHDGQFFFDTGRVVIGPQADAAVQRGNMQAGAGAAWYLPDTPQAIRPPIRRERNPCTFGSQTRPEDDSVFNNSTFIHGVHGVRVRANAGYGLWQLAFGSRAALTAANHAAARAAMMNFRSDQGRIPGVMPTTLVVPPTRMRDARSLLNTGIAPGGAASNVWRNTAELIVTAFVA